MSHYILPLVGLFFLISAAVHYAKALKAPLDSDGDRNIARKVRLKLAVVFGIVGLGLLALHLLTG